MRLELPFYYRSGATNGLDLDAASNWRMPDIDGDTLAFLQYTSGSTGTPKGVIASHGNLSMTYYSVALFLGLSGLGLYRVRYAF